MDTKTISSGCVIWPLFSILSCIIHVSGRKGIRKKQKSRNPHQVAKIWSSKRKPTQPMNKADTADCHTTSFLVNGSKESSRNTDFPTSSSSTPVICTHPTWAFWLQIHLLKEPCEKARSIRRGGETHHPPSYKSATWSCCGSGGSPDFLVRFLQTQRRGARAAGAGGSPAALGPGRGGGCGSLQRAGVRGAGAPHLHKSLGIWKRSELSCGAKAGAQDRADPGKV